MIAARPTADRRRRGAILLVVLALLALFAVIGLSFVLYAESEATAARIYREAKNNRDTQRPKPEVFAGAAVGQLIWGTLDPTSAFNGHDLARLMYGVDGTVPYNGVGLYHEPLTVPNTATPLFAIDRADVVHHGLQKLNPLDPATWVVVDPEYTRANGSVRFGNAGALAATLDGPTAAAALRNPANNFIYVAKNAAYTYPDRNNLMVAAADPLTGRVIVPSAHRPTLFRAQPGGAAPYAGASDLDAANANWVNASGRFKLLRPRPIDQLTVAEVNALRADPLFTGAGIPWPIPDVLTAAQAGVLYNLSLKYSKFPYPTPNPDGSLTGDVQNSKFGANSQRNDSVWLDAGLPVQEYKGRRLAPLVAITLLPLDSRVNLSASGNVKAAGVHGSNMGFGPHEINLGAVLATPADAATLANTRYLPRAGATAPGGGATAQDAATAVVSKAFPTTPGYSQVDWGGTAVANWLALPGSPAAPNGLANSPTYTTNAATDPTNHPALWSAFQRPPYQTSDANDPGTPNHVPHTYPLSDLKLFGGRYSGRGFDYQNQTFLANTTRGTGSAFLNEFAANTPGAPANRARALVTPFSVGFGKGTLAPNFLGTQTFALPAATLPNTYTSPAVAGATLDLAAIGAAGLSDERSRAGQVKVQNLRAALGGVNLNRPLADYRGPNTAESLARVLDASITPNLVPPGGGAPQPSASVVPLLEAAAWNDRQQMAADVFIRLCVATGAKIAFDENIPADAAAIPAGMKLPYSDNLNAGSYDPDAAGPAPAIPLRRGYVLPQPTGYDAATFKTTYTLTVNPVPNPPAPLPPPTVITVTEAEYNALRYLAQLAANIVDSADGDDVSTCFVWNPGTYRTGPAPGTPATATATNPVPAALIPAAATARSQPYDPAANPAAWMNALDPAYTAGSPIAAEERAVFGVEKPRLVLNEAYAEVANDKADAPKPPASQQATADFRVRFWLELLNPSAAETTPNTLLGGPDNTNAANFGAVPLSVGGAAVYRVQVFDKGTAVLNQLAKPGNVTGAVNVDDPVTGNGIPNTGMTASRIETSNTKFDDRSRLICDLTPATLTAPGMVPTTFVEPNNGQGAADAAMTQRRGFAVVGPRLDAATDNYSAAPKAFIPDTTAGKLFSLMLQKAAQTGATPNNVPDHLDYGIGRVQSGNIGNEVTRLNADPNRHVVLLQRLANPYLPPDTVGNTNPYVTVDVMSQVEVHDAVKMGSGTPPDTHTLTPESDRFAVGRVQPFAGYQDYVPATGTPRYGYPQAGNMEPTLTVKQAGQVADAMPEAFLMSFFRHNSQNATPPTTANDPAAGGVDPTLLTPFEWLTHLDRPLVNQAELLHVPAGPSHLLTRRFFTPAADSPVLARHTHDLQHRGAAAGPGDGPLFARNATTQAVDSPLYRALDLLQTKPWTHGVPLDGRQAGRVNINMLFDGLLENPLDPTNGPFIPSRVFRAVMDAQLGNGFTVAEVDAIWKNVLLSRSPQWVNNGNGTVRQTADELGANPPAAITQYDRPFKGLGTGLFTASAVNTGVVFPTGGALGPQFTLRPPGLEDTLLRSRPLDAAGNPPAAIPNGTTGLFQNPLDAVTHPYQQWEPLRKVLNNFSTTTDSYVLLVTVGFFEVLDDKSSPPELDAAGRPARVLRQEFFDDAPGDLRAQFVAVIDRTGVATDGVTNTAQAAQHPLTIEVQTAVAGGATGTRAELMGGFSVGNGTWAGTGPVPLAAEGLTHLQGTPPTTAHPLQDPPGSGGEFWQVIPKFQRDGGGNVIANSPETTTVTGTYDGMPITLSATFNPATGVSTSTTPFWVGTGDRLERVEPFIADASPASRWGYSPTSGALRVSLRPVSTPAASKFPLDPPGTTPPGRTTFAFSHEGGSVASNVVFRNPGPQPARTLKIGQSDPVVRLFSELK